MVTVIEIIVRNNNLEMRSKKRVTENADRISQFKMFSFYHNVIRFPPSNSFTAEGQSPHPHSAESWTGLLLIIKLVLRKTGDLTHKKHIEKQNRPEKQRTIST